MMAHGTDTLDLNTKFDPVNQVLYMEVNQVNFDVTGNYTGRLHFRKNNTVLEGAGVFRFSASRYHIADVEFAVNFSPYAGKFQVGYPSRFEPKAVENLNVEMTGLKCAVTGEPATSLDLYKLIEGYEKPGFMAFWPALVNFNMQVPYQLLNLCALCAHSAVSQKWLGCFHGERRPHINLIIA